MTKNIKNITVKIGEKKSQVGPKNYYLFSKQHPNKPLIMT